MTTAFISQYKKLNMASNGFSVGNNTMTIQELHPRDAIRWAVRSPDGRRSSTWRLWGDKKGDIYLSTRSLGSTLKLSIHRDRKCNVGFTYEYKDEARTRFGAESRHWARWALPDGKSVRAVQILIPDLELRHFESSEKNPMAWVKSAGPGTAQVFTLQVAEPASEMTWISPEESGILVGYLGTRSRMAWLVYTDLVLQDSLSNSIEENRRKLLEGASRQGLDKTLAKSTRAFVWGFHEQVYDPFFIEYALF